MPATYRYEVAKTGRAKCQARHDDEEAQKINKDDLRFGSLVTIQEHDSWKWKHWGCVTPAQIANILDQIGGLDGLDVDKDLDILDGYEELPEWAQDKIKYALQNGHVHDEDWNGDPELNVPGAKGLHKRSPKKKAKKDADEEDGNEDEQGSPAPKAKKSRGKKAAPKTDEDDEEEKPKKKAGRKRKADDDENDEEEKPKKKTGRKRKADDVENDEAVEEKPSKPKRAARKTKAVVKDEDNEDEDDEPLTETKKPATKKTKKRGDPAPTSPAEEDGADDDEKAKSSRGKTSKTADTKEKLSRGKKTKLETEYDAAVAANPLAAQTGRPGAPGRPPGFKSNIVKDVTVNRDGDDKLSAPAPAPAAKVSRGRGRPKK